MTEKLDHDPKVMSVNGEVSAAIYKPLDNTRQEIQLLTLIPSKDKDADIHCNISHAVPNTPSGNPVYEALSYVWGEPDFSEPIILNDHTFFITPILKYILSCLRRRYDQQRVLWVDAICIDQYREGVYRLLTDSQCMLGAAFREPTLWRWLWVMQELILAPWLTLMSRDSELSWDVLKNLFKAEPYFDAIHMGRAHLAVTKNQHKSTSWVTEYDSKRQLCEPMLFAQHDIFNAGIKNCETPCRLVGPGEDILVTKGNTLGTAAPVLQDDKTLRLSMS
ncbi:hypothetical protein ACKAV7_011230 [Fusarium commune]